LVLAAISGNIAAMSSDDAYEERYRFNLKTFGLISISVVFTLVAIFVPMGLAPRVVSLVFFGGSGVLLLFVAISRKVALRVDASGITLGGSPLRYVATAAHLPWRDVEAVVLWRQDLAQGLPYLGVLRPDGSPPLPGTVGGRAGQVLMRAGRAVAGAPDDRLVTSCRAISGWQVDTGQLAAALQRFASDVPLIDQR
jgi:hypothetical protein